MRYTSTILAASVIAILAYSIFFKKAPDKNVRNRIEVGTSSAEIPAAPVAPVAPVSLSKPTAPVEKRARVAKQKPRSFHISRKPAVVPGSAAVAAATGMTPAASEYKLTAADADKSLRPRDARNIINPADGRWISELSGQRAKLRMGVSRTDLSCDQDYRQCERPEGSQEVLVGGMVVKAERLVKNPATAMDGQISRGHYVRKTPAVYVK